MNTKKRMNTDFYSNKLEWKPQRTPEKLEHPRLPCEGPKRRAGIYRIGDHFISIHADNLLFEIADHLIFKTSF
jgi:hypothetical protein